MIFIAVAIILLCKFPLVFLPQIAIEIAKKPSSSLISRLFILVTRHPQHIPHLSLLPILSPNLRPGAS